MKIIILMLSLSFLIGCSGPRFLIKGAPAGKTSEQQSLDNLECSNYSQTQGPPVPLLFYVFSYAVVYDSAAKKYNECMTARGYQVEQQ